MSNAVLNIEKLERNASDLQHQFQTAEPFPHLVIDDFVDISPSVADTFPDSSWQWWHKADEFYIRNKRFCMEIDLIPEPFRTTIRELNEPQFLRFLEQITGIRQLLPDPYLFGGGLHLSGPGGTLTPHTDFHYYRFLNLYRRLNVIVYLNDDWSLNDGGCLTFYDTHGRAVQKVVPGWGRAVIFRTDDHSVHGFPDPIAEGSWRRSLALFYYTAAPAKDFSGDETTYYRQHGQQSGILQKGRFLAFRGLLTLSRNISIVAHIVNPNMGIPSVKAYFEYRRNAKRSRFETA